MDIYLQNTLSGTKEPFTPLVPGEVAMYNCGPTVYNYAHIGNLRSYVFSDLLRRMFEYNGYTVKQVMNITDIGHLSSDADDGEDKMTKALKREGKPLTLAAMREVADFYFDKFKDDLQALNIELPAEFPFASDNIQEDIDLIHTLTEKGFTYTTSDGIYFDTSKFPDYGKLGHIVQQNADVEQSRVGVNPEKKNYRDFALWKFNSEMGYGANFGKGFPGWHIECSAMSRKFLGQPFDIHTGGIDHVPVHHNNEIAQSEAAYGVPLAQYWMHNEHLNMGKEKMAKSGDNFITLQTLKEKNIDPLALRYLYLTGHYSTPMNFSWEALEGAEKARKKLKLTRHLYEKVPFETSISGTEKIQNYKNNFLKYINDDLDTPKAVALVWELISDKEIDAKDISDLILDFDKVLGLELDKPQEVVEIPEIVKGLMVQRNKAREEKNWALSDELRDKIVALGFPVQDTK
jgi:cysteinyl-tRNA synthetase